MKYTNVLFTIHLVNGVAANAIDKFVILKTEPYKHNEVDSVDLMTQISRTETQILTQGLPWKVGDKIITISPSQIAYIESKVSE